MSTCSRPHYSKGITLVETIVAVMILAAAIAGPMTLASQSLKATRDARNELIATHLAEEGGEVLHSVRDNNSAADTSVNRGLWLTNILAVCQAGCAVDVTDHTTPVWGPNVLIPCPLGDCTQVGKFYYNAATGLYRQNAAALPAPWSETNYTRVLKIFPVDDPTTPVRQVRFTSTVTYVGFGNTIHTISIADDLYNWFPALK